MEQRIDIVARFRTVQTKTSRDTFGSDRLFVRILLKMDNTFEIKINK